MDVGDAPRAWNSEVYTALQTKLVGGQENGLVTIETAKLYEVQKYVAETNHIWDAFCVLANRRSLGRLPNDLAEMVQREFAQSVHDQRADEQRLDASLKNKLQGEGMTFVAADKAVFQAALRKTSFYPDWKAKFGDEGWSALQAVSGQLA